MKLIRIEEAQKIMKLGRTRVLEYIDEGILIKQQMKKGAIVYIEYLSIPPRMREAYENNKVPKKE